MSPYLSTKKFKNAFRELIIAKYQRINKFYIFEEYVSKSLLYINHKIFKDKFPSDYNYMFDLVYIQKKKT